MNVLHYHGRSKSNTHTQAATQNGVRYLRPVDSGDFMEKGLCHGRKRPSWAAERMLMFSLLYSEEKHVLALLYKRCVTREATSAASRYID